MKKGLLMAACLAAIGATGLIASPQHARADANDTGFCLNMGYAVGVTDAGTSGDLGWFMQRMASHAIYDRCNDWPSQAQLDDVCRRWNSEAAYSSAAGRRAKLYNGDVVPVGLANGQLFSPYSPSYGAGGKTFGYHNCTFFGGENRPVVTPPVVVPPVVITNPPNVVGNGQPLTGRNVTGYGAGPSMPGSGGIIKDVDSTTATGMN